MDKSAIKKFATWARVQLKQEVQKQAAVMGITAAAIQEPLPASTRDILYFDQGTGTPSALTGETIRLRQKVVDDLKQRMLSTDYATAFEAFVETMAATWFNRLAAIRYMEVNGYISDGLWILGSQIPGKIDPDLVTTPLDSNLDFTVEEKRQLLTWKENQELDEVFNFLLLKRCHQLADILPGLFEKAGDVSDFFFHSSFIDRVGVVYHLTHDIPAEDWQNQVQIIGWLYQYYNAELKDQVYAGLKKGQKVTKEKIPAATQLFTPDWIVRYMVENSLGRIWIQGHISNPSQEKELAEKFGWKYYLPEAQQEPEVEEKLKAIRAEYAQLRPEDLTVLDPCMGSGHILAYAFDVLMQIYTSVGYLERDAAEAILEHNLYGLDIDDRAYQLAYFSVLMKARQYSRRILRKHPQIHICAIEDSQGLQKWSEVAGQDGNPEQLSLDDQYVEMADYLIDTFNDAKEFGSLITVEKRDYKGLLDYIDRMKQQDTGLFMSAWIQEMADWMPGLVKQAEILSKKYNVVVTNPPYMGIAGMSAILSTYAKNNYPNSKGDLSTIMMERSMVFCSNHGYISMINIPVWMFLITYNDLRKKLIQSKTYINLIHIGRGIFGSDFGTTTFIVQNSLIQSYKSLFKKLFDQQGEVKSVTEREKEFLTKPKTYIINQNKFSSIPGCPVAYWASENVYNFYDKASRLENIAILKQGFATTDNNRFLRFWFEINKEKFSTNLIHHDQVVKGIKWVPYNKGGAYRTWFGNLDYVCNWENAGYELKKHPKAVLRNLEFQFKKSITWSLTNSSYFGARSRERGSLFDTNGMSLFCDEDMYYFILSYLCSKPATEFMKMINPTLASQVGDVSRLPIKLLDSEDMKKVESLAKECVNLSKKDWDSFEISWDFMRHPLINDKSLLVSETYTLWKQKAKSMFQRLKHNEEALNKIFIIHYGLENELNCFLDDKDITITSIYESKNSIPESIKGNNCVLTKVDITQSLISYAVGCMLGRYSLDVDGLAYAGGEWDASKYSTFIPDEDNVIPMTDEAYLSDDIVGLCIAWLKKVYGKETLEENLKFIGDALEEKGLTPRDVLRTYFLKSFYKNHCKIYQKRPIYWLFDSGKENGFKALVYMHRWNKDTTSRVLLYVHKIQNQYETEVKSIDMALDTLKDKRQAAALQKRKEHLLKQIAEVKDYSIRLEHLANEHTEIDLDDGVKVNYEKVQTDKDGKFYQILAPIK